MNGELLDSLPERAIAVVGMSGRFPGAPTVDHYWANLRAGVCSLREFSREELLADGIDPALLDRPDYVAAKGYLEDADRFEAELFGFTRREAALLDPQHRLLLETAWGALEDAGRDPLDVGVRTGVYVGGGTSEHMIAALADPTTGADLGALNVRLLTDKDFLASWISYRLGLDGPAMAVQTACSTSLTAVHVAVQALLLGECDLALAGGVAIDSVRREGYVHQSGGIMSRDGRCRPFSAEADGTVRGNGVGLVALRRLEDAVADGDPIHAVIRGTAAVNDGSDKIGFTAPGERGQFTAMTEALAAADLEPAAIGYIEMHGTATSLGDRIEVAATSAAYAGATRVGIGSVKSNLGHLDAAAGVAGLIKAALMVRHGEFVPTVNVQEPNPDLALDATPLRIVDTAGAWTTLDGSPRRAGVSSVGLGGSNVHVILEQAPDIASAPATDSVVLPVSARTPEQATATAHALADALEQNTNIDLATAAATLQHGRARLTHRGYVAAKNRAEAVTGLRSLTTHESTTTAGDGALFVFPGQASQYVGMGRELYERFPAFRDALDRCANILRTSHGIDPRSWLTAPEAGTRGATEYWQPTIVSVEYAAAELLRSRGVEPAAMVGHSIGEYVAAHLAGVLSLDDALRLVAERGRLMADAPPGAMLAVRAAENDVARLLSTSVDLAAVNGPESCVVAGTPEAVARLAESLTANRIIHRDLGVNYAFHSRLMDDVLDEFRAIVAKEVSLNAPTGNGYVSTVSGTWITPDQATDPNFWTDQIRRPVRFADAVRTAGAAVPGPIVEAGPGAGLDGQARRILDGRPAYPLLGRGGTEETSALTTFGALWLHDVPVTLNDPTPRRGHLPGYHFAGTSYGALSLRPQPAHVPGSDSNSDSSPEPEPVIEESPDLDSVEERIAELLRTTLGVSEPEDQEVSYLAAGGESLTAVHLGGRLRDDFGLEVPITLLLEPIPLRALAKRIAAEGQPPEDGLLASLLGELEAESGAESGE
ncbi:MAG TPA: beta-ketoacyl synthase N-terminal-like domain-containing protein [Actinospica sp.]|nr:beta-ketoacyl synthase N-terminal-like domain-containing protein [Actinospica sp.]